LSVSPSAWNNWFPAKRIFSIIYWEFLLKSVEEIEAWLKAYKKNRRFTCRSMTYMIISSRLRDKYEMYTWLSNCNKVRSGSDP
jgi:hypothetical protein